ncbi:ABC transporter permease [Syntrophothermus lipocalidus]|uniref:Binding-protein-dependent transport systems inner membrane component n=1 Tax=Syntrophothermus lipocalidus (strain DSM 12680 / TGB-C1) TaxID=643648 RepID=D7CL34_SYNLT|nr:ABC transporter permease [Syntrophothermus lipocalidus]ADI01419.1 binding-protein-dependent transport systems inner membrane component [Syntrophothermus lipocalidus DSM 12680]
MISFSQFLSMNSTTIITATVQHLYLALGSELIGCLIAIPFGIWLTRREKLADYVLAATGSIQTIPSLALLGFVLPLLGIGPLPAMVVLVLYSLLPVIRNTYTGIRNVNPVYIEAGTGVGMNSRQLLWMVKFPLALPIIMAGVRISTVYLISWATLAAFIGAGGLGDLIITGIQTADANFIIAGTVPTAVLAIGAGWILGKVEMFLTPRGSQLVPDEGR